MAAAGVREDHDGLWTRAARAAARVHSDAVLALLDCVLVTAAYTGVLVLRFETAVPDRYREAFALFLAVALMVHLGAHWMWGLYGQMWRHASVQEARRVILAGGSASVALAVLFLPGQRSVPASVVLLGSAITTMLVGVLRFQARLFAFRRGTSPRGSTRVAVIGAGMSGAAIVREMLRDPAAGLVPVVILDDDLRKQGRHMIGVPVIGGLDALPDAVQAYRAEQALLAIPSAGGELVRRVASAADAVGITLKVLPSVRELVGGRVSVRDVRDLSIDDLLGRKQVETDLEAVRAILRGRRVLITGAGGSIGSEIARQVAACGPAALLLADHDETHLHDAAASVGERCIQLLADIRDRDLLDDLFGIYAPEVVFHAAAHKHVPLLEAHPCEAVNTNVLGTANVVAVCRAHQVKRLVFISTDKAVRPSSVMGASKWLGEHITLTQAPALSHYCAVRFGNVLGSRGSVIPTFMRQIDEGGPVTVTDPRMTRFFMSIPEAVQLVLQAAALSKGGEVFMLEMGEPVRILELAERMIRLSGRRVGEDIPIRITGMRPGEKLAEELHAPEETPHPTPHPSIVALYPPPLDTALLRRSVDNLARLARQRDSEATARALMALPAAAHEPLHVDDADVVPVPLDLPIEEARWNRSST